MPNNNQNNQGNTSKRGFASMDPEQQRRIASEGGQAAQESGHAHKLTAEERSRGGQNSGGNFANRPTEEVQDIARRGGKARGENRGDRSEGENG